jgi:hypothetical protein
VIVQPSILTRKEPQGIAGLKTSETLPLQAFGKLLSGTRRYNLA